MEMAPSMGSGRELSTLLSSQLQTENSPCREQAFDMLRPRPLGPRSLLLSTTVTLTARASQRATPDGLHRPASTHLRSRERDNAHD